MSNHVLVVLFAVTQIMYTMAFLMMFYFFLKKVNWVRLEKAKELPLEKYPKIILLYPVLRELEETMRSTFLGISEIDYPKDKWKVISIPNWDDKETIDSLEKLRLEFPFLEIMVIPATSDASWDRVWQQWQQNDEVYWWHQGKTKGVTDLPPKKTRQLIYAFYRLVESEGEDWLLNYIDADSIPPRDHFLAAAAGIGVEGYDVLQSTNVAGNLLDSLPATFCAMDHMEWDGLVYPHMSDNGHHPFWVLGKGLFFKAKDLVEFGGFNPWITIEDPEVGMRLWTNGKKLGVIANPLVEEVPLTLKKALVQRYRWMCGFYQSLSTPTLKSMGMSWGQRQRARLNLVPCLSLFINTVGLPVGIWALVVWLLGISPIPWQWSILALVNIAAYVVLMTKVYVNTWQRTAYVLDNFWKRFYFMLRVNPIFLWVYWMIWSIPIAKGYLMYLKDEGKTWIRTDKYDKNHDYVRERK